MRCLFSPGIVAHYQVMEAVHALSTSQCSPAIDIQLSGPVVLAVIDR